GKTKLADHRLEQVGWRGAAPAVVQIDERSVGVERARDLRPVGLVAGQLRRRPRPCRPLRGRDALERVYPKGGESEARGETGKKRPPIQGHATPPVEDLARL